jgi:hypothetical protein
MMNLVYMQQQVEGLVLLRLIRLQKMTIAGVAQVTGKKIHEITSITSGSVSVTRPRVSPILKALRLSESHFKALVNQIIVALEQRTVVIQNKPSDSDYCHLNAMVKDIFAKLIL